MKLTSTHYFIIAIIVIFGGIVAFRVIEAQKPGEYDTLAQCIADSGATFYGAFWCPHCKEQKEMFGPSEEYLPYVECSLPSGNGQTQECIDAGIETYPTWELAGGERLRGTQTLEVLAEKTSCELVKDPV